MYRAHLAGWFHHWSLWRVPVVDLMDGRRVPWVVKKTRHCRDEAYRHLLRDPSRVLGYWQFQLINTRVFGRGGTCAHLTSPVMTSEDDGRVPHSGS